MLAKNYFLVVEFVARNQFMMLIFGRLWLVDKFLSWNTVSTMFWVISGSSSCFITMFTGAGWVSEVRDCFRVMFRGYFFQ